MLEISRDGRRIYVTNSLYGAWDEQFYPEGIARMGRRSSTSNPAGGIDARSELLHDRSRANGRIRFAWRAATASSDSYCYP